MIDNIRRARVTVMMRDPISRKIRAKFSLANFIAKHGEGPHNAEPIGDSYAINGSIVPAIWARKVVRGRK